MDALDILRGLSRNDAFANERLFAACARLGPGEYEATRTSFFPSLKETLEHLHLVHVYYFDALIDGGRGRSVFDDLAALPALPQLRTAQRALDVRTVDFVAALDASALDREIGIARKHGVELETIGETLLHLYEHQIHHRGQIHAMLAGSSVAPPPLDEYFLRPDRPVAERELAEAGHSPPHVRLR